MNRLIIGLFIFISSHKQLLSIAASIVATSTIEAQINNGGNVVNMGFMYPSISDLSLVPSPRPVGLQIICLCDSMAHIWDGNAWHTNLDSARINRDGYIKKSDLSAGAGITYNSSTGVIANTGSGKRQEYYSGTTNASGLYIVVFPVAFAVAPNIQANPIGGTTEQFLKITSVSTTGFTINVFQRANVLSLALSTATTNVTGAAVDVVVTEK